MMFSENYIEHKSGLNSPLLKGQEEFNNTKGVIGRQNSKKGKQYRSQKKNDKQWSTHHNAEDWEHNHHSK